MNKIVIIGGGGHSKIVISILKKIKNYEIMGYTDIQDKGELLKTGYLGNDKILEDIIKSFPGSSAVIGIGNVEVGFKRKILFEKLENLGFDLPAIISPSAIINEDVSIAKGTIVCDGVIVNSGSKIGKGVILNTKCSVDHDCEICDFVHLAPGVILSGGVTVGNNSFIGAGSIIIQYKKISENCLIGAGSIVINDIKERGVYIGNPAKRVKWST